MTTVDAPALDLAAWAESGALRVGPAVLAAGAPDGPLAGTTTVVKDLIAVAGHPVAAGNPDWLADAPVPAASAPVLQAWVDAGATVVGIAHTDELAFSLSGTNVHYGTPRNPIDPERVPGGSSAGSAAAVAAGLVRYAMGTDTGGSIRVPSSYCGIVGLRTTHGRLPVAGVVPLAPRFDTVGVVAGTGAELARAAGVLLERFGTPSPAPELPTALVWADDVAGLAEPATAVVVRDAAAGLAGVLGVGLRSGELAGASVLERWRGAFMARQLPDIWATHGAWVTSRKPSFGPGVTARMQLAAAADPSARHLADQAGGEVLAAVDALVPDGGVLLLPSASGPAPRIDLPAEDKNDLRGRTLAMTCPAGLAGLPAVSLPLGTVGGLPVGLCALARPGQDELLVRLAAAADALAPVTG